MKRHTIACTLLVTLCSSAWVQAQELPTLAPAMVLTGHKTYVRGVAISKDGKYLASAGEDTAFLWDLTTRKVKFELKVEDYPAKSYSVAFSPDGKSVAVGGHVGKVFLFSIATGKLEHTYTEPSLAVLCLSYSPDGKLLAALHDQAQIMIFDVGSKQLIGTLKADKGAVQMFSFASDSKMMAGITRESLVIWDIPTKAVKKTINVEGSGPLDGFNAVACSPTMSIVAANGGEILKPKTGFWDLKTFELKGYLVADELEPTQKALRFSPDGRYLATAGSAVMNQAPVSIWDVSSGNRLLYLTGATEESITNLAYSSDGRRIAGSSLDKTIRVWNVGGGSSSTSSSKTKARTKTKAKTKKSDN